MTELLQEIIQILVAGITQIASGIGSGLSTLVTEIFLTTTETGTQLSTFGGVVIVFGGIGLAIGLCRWVLSFVTSLGAFN